MHFFALVLVRHDVQDVSHEVYRLLYPFQEREDELLCSCVAGLEPLPCRVCDGSGTVIDDDNRASLFDWMMIGGRFDGRVSGRDPAAFRDLCRIMEDSMTPPQELPDGRIRVSIRNEEKLAEAMNANTEEMVRANVVPVRDVPLNVRPSILVTPDGCWHQRGFPFKEVSTEYEDDWQRNIRGILSEHQDHLAVGCDIHT